MKNPFTFAAGASPSPRLHRTFAHYETALLTFVRLALEGTALRVPTPPPPQDADASYQALGQLYAVGTLRALVYDGGWRLRFCDDGPPFGCKRIWESARWEHLSLHFGPSTLALAPLLFSAVQSQRCPDSEALTAHLGAFPPQTSAEDLLVTLLLRPWIQEVQAPNWLTPWLRSTPLCTLCYGPLLGAQGTDPAQIHAACERWSWAFPWLDEAWCQSWLTVDDRKLRLPVANWDAHLAELQAWLKAFLLCAQDAARPDWLLPLLRFFCRSTPLGEPAAAAEPLDWRLQDETLAERQRQRDRWACSFRIFEDVDRWRQRLLQQHPIERSVETRFFLAWWEHEGISAHLARATALRRHLERTTG